MRHMTQVVKETSGWRILSGSDEVWTNEDNQRLAELCVPYLQKPMSHDTGALRGRIPNRIVTTSAVVPNPPTWNDYDGHIYFPQEAKDLLHKCSDMMTMHESVEPFFPIVFARAIGNTWQPSRPRTYEYLMGIELGGIGTGLDSDNRFVGSELFYAFMNEVSAKNWDWLDVQHFSNEPEFNAWVDGADDIYMLLRVLPLRKEQQDTENETTIHLSPFMSLPEMHELDGALRDTQSTRETWLRNSPWHVAVFREGHRVGNDMIHVAQGTTEQSRVLLPSQCERYEIRSRRRDIVGGADAHHTGAIALVIKGNFAPTSDRVYTLQPNSSTTVVWLDPEEIVSYDFRWEEVDVNLHLSGGNIRFSERLHREPTCISAVAQMVRNIAYELWNETSDSNTTHTTDSDVGTVTDVVFVETWQDNRGWRLVDLCAITLEPLFFHEFLRCVACNGQVEVKIPKTMPASQTECPHCGTADGVQWPHCVVPRPLKE